MAIYIGGKKVQETGGTYQPQGVNRPTQKQQNQYKAMADSMKEAGIRSLSGRTTDDDKGEIAREIQKDYGADRSNTEFTPYEDTLFNFGDVEGAITETAGDPLKQSIVSNILKGRPPFSPNIDKEKTGVFGINFNNLRLPNLPTPLGFGIEALQGIDSTNQFFKNLNTKKSGELSDRDKITLINLIQRGGEGGGLQYLEKWAEDNDLSEEETLNLANKFTGEYSNIASSISDSGIIDYLTEGGRPEGFKDSVAAMFGQYDSGKIPGRVIGDKLDEYGDPLIEDVMVDRPNLQTVTDNLGTVGLEYLKATNPAAFYALRPAATRGQIEELAGMALTGNKNFDNQIFAAREELNRMGNQQGGGQGIMAASSTPPVVPPVVPPTTPDVPPVVPPVVPPTTTTPFDLAQFYAGLPTFNQSPYARQGLGSYNEILRRYYG